MVVECKHVIKRVQNKTKVSVQTHRGSKGHAHTPRADLKNPSKTNGYGSQQWTIVSDYVSHIHISRST